MDVDSIVEARIHPAIGIARVGNSADEYFIGPEIPSPAGPPPGGYRDAKGSLKRQAARFRIFGYNSQGEVVGEVTSDIAEIEWTVHVANKKAGWYQYDMALDIKPEASSVVSARRNSTVVAADRLKLAIDPGRRSISGKNQGGVAFDSGKFFDQPVYLGELRTDEAGRLLFLGGFGRAGSPFLGYTLVTFANNPAWYDDVSDGPVDAKVKINGKHVPVDAAWVVTAPPNYAPDVISPVTMYDLVYDTLAGTILPNPGQPSFTNDILPLFQRLSALQWVNVGFLAQFGHGAPNDFYRPDYLQRLAMPGDTYAELRRQIHYMFRSPSLNIPFQAWQWPQLYGDALGISITQGVESPRAALALTPTQYGFLTQWMNGAFTADYDPSAKTPQSLDDYALADQPDTLDRAALTFCLGGPFHPGSEMTWPMRRSSMYRGKFRLRRHPEGFDYPDYGDFLNQTTALAPSGPLAASGAGDITRWMSVPWHADAASCQQGYPSFENVNLFNTDPYLPSFWPARAPNEVLALTEYQIVMDEKQPLADRIGAFQRRRDWVRHLGGAQGPYVPEITRMVSFYGQIGVVERRPGVPNDPNFPDVMYVENLADAPQPGPPEPFSAPRTLTRERLRARFGGHHREL